MAAAFGLILFAVVKDFATLLLSHYSITTSKQKISHKANHGFP